MSQILDKLFLGSLKQAQNEDYLKQNNITHILTCASNIDLSQNDTKRKYLQLGLIDKPNENILNYLPQAFEFLDKIIHSEEKDQNVLVHCLGGISRSVSIVIAYVMITYCISFKDAFKKVSLLHKKSKPNEGFMTQLEFYGDKLEQQYFNQVDSIEGGMAPVNIGLLKSIIQFNAKQCKQIIPKKNNNWRDTKGKKQRKDQRQKKNHPQSECVTQEEFNFNEIFSQMKKSPKQKPQQWVQEQEETKEEDSDYN